MPKQKQEIDKVRILMPRDMHRSLKAKLALKGQSLSSWIREKTKIELKDKVGIVVPLSKKARKRIEKGKFILPR
jgi:hypothetical protein